MWDTDRDAIFKVTKKRYFPLGIYYDLPDEASMERRVADVPFLKSLGVDHVFTPMYDFNEGPNADFIRECLKEDLKIAPELAGDTTWHSLRELFSSMNATHLVEIVQVVDDVDEKSGSDWVHTQTSIANGRDAADGAFSNAMSWVSGGYNDRAHHAAGLTDLYARQAYPMFGGNGGDTKSALDYWRNTQLDTDGVEQPLIATPQLFPGDRLPSPVECLEMSMYALLLKLEGIVWYTANMGGGWNLADEPDYADVVRRVCSYVKREVVKE